MKKILTASVLILCLLLCGCSAKNPQPADPEPDPAPPAEPSGLQDDGTFICSFMGLRFAVPEGWSVVSREKIADTLGYNETYAKSSMEAILAMHAPYYDMWATSPTGSSVTLMIENPPVTLMDNTEASTPAQYMDGNKKNLPAMFRALNINVFTEDRDTVELAGHTYERFSMSMGEENDLMYQTMYCTEKDGYLFTIYLTCRGGYEPDDLSALFSAAG